MELPLIKETGNQSFCEGHGTRYWQFSVNGHFFGLRMNLPGTITHYDVDLKGSKKFHVEINKGKGVAYLQTDSFRDAYNYLVEHTVKPRFKHS